MARPQPTVFTTEDAARKLYVLTLQNIYREAGRKFESEQNTTHVKKFIDFLVHYEADVSLTYDYIRAQIGRIQPHPATKQVCAVLETIHFSKNDIFLLFTKMQTLDLSKSIEELTPMIMDFMLEIHIAQGDPDAIHTKLTREAAKRGFTEEFVQFLFDLHRAVEQNNRNQAKAPETSASNTTRTR